MRVVEPRTDADAFGTRFYQVYRRVLLAAVRYPLVTVLVVAAIFFAALEGLAYVPNIFFPPSDTPMFTAEIESPIGTAIERSESIIGEIDEFVANEFAVSDERPDGVTSWTSYIGEGAPRFVLGHTPEPPSPEYGFLLVNATSRAVIAPMIEQLEEFVRERFPDVVATIRPLQLGPPVTNPVEVRISGEDEQTVFRLADDVKAKLREMGGTKNLGDNWGQRTKKINVQINGPRARRSGISHQDIAISLLSVLTGYDATDYREGDQVIPVTMRSVAADRQDIGKIESLNVYSQVTGRSVPLKQVADLEVEWQPSKIFRRDRLKSIKVYADLEPGLTASEITDPLIPWLEEQQESWPLGYFYGLGGEFETSGKGNRSIGEKLPIAGLIIVLLLVASRCRHRYQRFGRLMPRHQLQGWGTIAETD